MRGKPNRGRKTKVGLMTVREIAKALGISHATVLNACRTGLAKLRAGLSDWEEP